MQKSKRRRLSAEAWRGMLERFEGSGLPAESFCEQPYPITCLASRTCTNHPPARAVVRSVAERFAS